MYYYTCSYMDTLSLRHAEFSGMFDITCQVVRNLVSSSPSTYREQDKCKCNLHFILVGTFRMTLPSFYHNFVT